MKIADRSGFKSIAVNAAFLSSARIFTSFARAFYAIYLARCLGAELYGFFNYGLSWYILFIPVSTLGLDTILIRQIGINKHKAPSITGQFFILRSASSIAFAFLSIIMALIVEADFNSKKLLFIFSFALFGRGMSLWSNAVFRGFEKSSFVFFQEFSFRLIEIIVGVCLLSLGYGIYELAIMHAMIWVIQSILGLFLVRFYMVPFKIKCDSNIMVTFIKTGFPFVLEALFSSWILQGPVLMFRYLKGINSDLGQLTLALQAFFILGMIFSEFANAALPVLSRSALRNDGKTNDFTDFVLRGGLLAGGVLIITSVAIANWGVAFFLGSGYETASSLIPLSVLLVTPYFWIISIHNIIIAHGKFWIIPITNASGALLLTFTFPILLRLFGMKGVFFSIGSGLSIMLIWQFFFLNKHKYNIPLQKLFSSGISILIATIITLCFKTYNQWVALIFGLSTLILTTLLLGGVKQFEIKETIKIMIQRKKKKKID